MQARVSTLTAAAERSDLAYQLVEGLTTEVGPRLAGSPAEARARAWALRELRRLRFDVVREEPFTIPYWARLTDRAAVEGQFAQPLTIAALGGSPATPPGGVSAEIVRFASLEELTAADPAQVRGKIVFIDEPIVRTQDGLGYAMAVRKRGRCAPLAQERGAVACLIRSVGTHSHRFAHQGGNARQAAGTSLPAAAVSPPDADQLTRLLARGPVRVRLEIAVAMTEDAPSGNIIAELRGRERPEEIVLIGAHLDSWDLATGALDDGAGVGIVIGAAHLIAQLPQRPRRTIRVVLFGAEETGIHGALAYARQHADALPRHIAAAESDFGSGVIYRLRTRFGEGALPHARALHAALLRLGVGPGDNAGNGGPDLTPLRLAGVPILEPSQDGWDYFNFHHTADDTLDKVDRAALRQNVAVYAAMAYLVADSDWDLRAPLPPPPPSAPPAPVVQR